MSTPDPSTGQHRAVVVGSGLAGLTTALELGDCTLVTRGAVGDGASGWAQGGIAAALGVDDAPALHAADTSAVGGGLTDVEVARIVTEAAAERIDWLRALGVPFDRSGDTEDAPYSLGREAGHQRHRIVHAAGDGTGAAVIAALRSAVAARDDITVIDARALDLLHDGGHVTGLAIAHDDHVTVLDTANVVLATGGFGWLYARTTNPPVATGAGLAMALRAGVRVRDLEFVQFHPTALETTADPLPLVTEALRGAGGVLIDADGHRYMPGVHPDAELAPRDIVARANWMHRQQGPIYLDTRALTAPIEQAFPTVVGIARAAGLDPHEPLPVTPAQHYTMGGIATDLDGRTSLPGLFACGEVASTGLHGANRLASNSLLEAMVLARRLAAVITAEDRPVAALDHARTPRHADDVSSPGPDDLQAIAELRQAMWDHAGPVRDAPGLARGLDRLTELAPRLVTGADGRDLAAIAEVVLRTAAARRESRGAHHRRDHPALDPNRARSTVLGADDPRGPRLVTALLASVPAAAAREGSR